MNGVNTMTELTAQQKYNRAYHARNAEKINAKKKEQYYQKKTTIQMKLAKRQKPDQSNSFQHKMFNRPPDQKSLEKSVTQADKAKCKVRRQIEDWHLARELEIEDFYTLNGK